MTALRRSLDSGLEAMGLALSERQRETLVAYVGLLAKWNRAYNLTAVRDPAQMVVRHLLDSLAVVPFVGGPAAGDSASGACRAHWRVIDVGTGPGLPGIPLAITFPGHEVHLLDSNGKKTRFLTQAKAELGLGNVTVIHSRVEDYRPDERFDVVISRAFATLSDIVSGCRHLLAEQGVVLAMKGKLSEEELAGLPPDLSVKVAPLSVPDLDEARHLITIAGADRPQD